MPLLSASLVGVAACTVGAAPDDGVELGEATPDGLEPERPEPTRPRAREATVGDLCLYADEPPEQPMSTLETHLTTDDALVAEVTLPWCLSGSCDVGRQARCTITRDGDTLTVTADFEYLTTSSGYCTLDCEVLTATCRTEPLQAGTYVIEHAGQSAELAVPSTFEPCVIEPTFCEHDRDCAEGFCGGTVVGDHVCREYSEAGEACGGYGPPGLTGVCAPGLFCNTEGLAADLPGTCEPERRAPAR